MDIKQLSAIVMQVLSILTLIGGVWSVVTLLMLIIHCARRKNPIVIVERYLKFFASKAYIGGFIVALIAMSGSLYFSDVAKYTPCKLCWYQRIVMYPMVALFLVSLIKRARHISDHILTLAGIGAVIATFHYYEQITNTQVVTCGTVGFSQSCTEKFFLTFGYITIPMMALTAFVMIILLMIMSKCAEKKAVKPLLIT